MKVRHRLINTDDLKELTESAGLYQHHTWWMSVREGMGYNCFGLLSGYGDIEVLNIFYETKKGPLKLVGSPLRGSFTDCLKPLAAIDMNPGSLTEILISQHHYIKEMGASYIEWGFKDKTIDVHRFSGGIGAIATEKGTLVLEVENDEQLMWQKMESRSRNMVRKAEKSGVVIRCCDGTPQEVDTFYEMLKDTFAKNCKMPPHPRNFYYSLVKNLIPAGRLLFLSAELEGRVVAMGIFPHDRDEIHFLSGTSNGEGGRCGANNLIQWSVIKYAVKNGIGNYDLGGTGVPSIDKFKASFGGQPYRYVRFVWKTPLAFVAEKIFLRAKSSVDRIATLKNRGS